MTKEQFKAQYIVTFVATLTAQQYEECCSRGEHSKLRSHHMMEDAIFLADYAWDEYQKQKLGVPKPAQK